MTHTAHQNADASRDEGRWQMFTGKARELWGDLTDDEMDQFKGNYDQTIGYLKKKYGDAADQLQDWWHGLRA